MTSHIMKLALLMPHYTDHPIHIETESLRLIRVASDLTGFEYTKIGTTNAFGIFKCIVYLILGKVW